MKPTKLVSVIAVAGLLVAGCGNGSNQPSPSPSVVEVTVTASEPPSVPATTQPAPPTSAAPASSAAPTQEASATGPFGTAPTEQHPGVASGTYEITAIRVGAHAGYDRVVIELDGGQAAQVTWLAEYDPNPITQGRGDPVELGGGATLRVIVRGLIVPPNVDPPRGLLADSAHGQITGVYADPVFEGQSVIFIGLPTEAGFHINMLDSPTRIVVDIQNA